MKIRATIDLDNDDEYETRQELGSVEHGVFGVDKDGVYHMYYSSRSDLVEFKDVEVLDNPQDIAKKYYCGTDGSKKESEWEKI